MAEGPVTLQDIEQARERLTGVVKHTPLELSRTFSSIIGADTYLKMENMQKTGSFKIRGAYNKIHAVCQDKACAGVIAASAGNHAQGVAYAASQAGIPATIVMPETAPLAKIMATRNYGAKVVLSGQMYDEAYQHAIDMQERCNMTFVQAFDDKDIIAGQGTVGLEILEDLPDVDAIVVPIGGGGLIAGIATAVKALKPRVKVFGVQASGAPAVCLSKKSGKLLTNCNAHTIADGIAVKVPGDLTFPIIERLVDDVVLVEDEETASTILMLMERCKTIAEGAGAVALAALLHGKIKNPGKKVAAVVSGGNVDVNFVSRIIERGLVKAGRRVSLQTIVSDRPGALRQLLNIVSEMQANVITIYHDRLDPEVTLSQASVELSLETRDKKHTEELLAALEANGYDVLLKA